MTGVFLRAEWRQLLLLNYEVDPALLRGRVPEGCEVDFHEGKTFVSVVGFMMQRTRILGMPIPFHCNFEEVNLRFYIKRPHPEGDRRAVSFVKELVPRWAIATVARVLYNENYVALPMSHRWAPDAVEYGWRDGPRSYSMSARIAGPPTAPAAGSHASFIIEHYWGYVAQRDGGTVEYQVEHPPWRTLPITDAKIEGDLGALYGADFAPVFARPPVSTVLAEGSPVLVRWGTRI